MFANISNRACAFVLLLLASISASVVCGCAVPLAPGYQVEKESLTVRFLSNSPPHLAVRADYRLRNVGTAPLSSIEVTLPAAAAFGRDNLRVHVAATEITPEQERVDLDEAVPAAGSAGSLWRIPLPEPLRQKRQISMSFEYELAAAPPADPRIFAAPHAFYLNDSGWFPEFQEPKRLLATDIVRPNPTDLSVTVPAGFRVTASGRPRGVKKQNTQIEYRFRIRPSDFAPYIIAGQYSEQRVSARGLASVIWTFRPISPVRAQQAAEQIAVARSFYSQNFGRLPKSVTAIYDVELPEEAAARNRSHSLSAISILPGVVYNWGIHSAEFLPSVGATGISESVGPTELAHTWFAHLIVPRPDSWTLADGLAFYAATALAKGSEVPASPSAAIQPDLSDYQRQTAAAVEKPIRSLASSDPDAQLKLGADKIKLFFFALEDKCGRQNLSHAIAHMVYALRGQEYGYSDFRAALEGECHQDLAAFFRAWLNQPGIPPDFRARYEHAPSR